MALVAFFVALATRGHSSCLSPPSPASSGSAAQCVADPARRVVLISLDGFRADYVSRILASTPVPGGPTFPAFRWLLTHGSRAQAMLPVFPSKTFVNHYTVATGLWPAWHGIIANAFVLHNASGSFPFNMQTKDPNFWLGEPIWVTAQKAGLQARTTGWPGSEVALQSWNPLQTAAPFNYSQSPAERVDAVLALLRSPSGPPALSTLYLNDADDAGHATGPDSDAVEAAIATLDAALWRLLQGMNASGLLAGTHVMVTSDHGMASTCGCGRTIPAAVILPASMVNKTSSVQALLAAGAELNGPFVGMPCDGCTLAQARSLAGAMNAAAAAAGYGSVFTASAKQDLPARFTGYGASSRVWPVMGLPAPGYVVSTDGLSPPSCAGTHGWDVRYAAMHATLLAAGPRFVPGAILPPPKVAPVAGAGQTGSTAGGSAGVLAAGGAGMAVPNTEVYGIIAELLGAPPAPNNGTPGYPRQVLLPRC